MQGDERLALATFFDNKAVDYVFVFGSYLNHARSDSDIDILLNGNYEDFFEVLRRWIREKYEVKMRKLLLARS